MDKERNQHTRSDNQPYDPGHRVTGKYIVKAKLKSRSPVLIGQGEGDENDVIMIRDGDDVPFIPGSSVAGKLRANIDWAAIKKTKKDVKAFWGTEDPREDQEQGRQIYQSHIIIEDMYPLNQEAAKNKITVRDGVLIVPEKGTAQKGGKYDYELLEPEVEFDFYAEITLRAGFDVSVFEQCIQYIHKQFDNDFRIGAFSTSGFGKLELVDFLVYRFRFPDDAGAWLEFRKVNKVPMPLDLSNVSPIPSESQNTFRIEADFKIKSALITGSYGVNAKEPDKAQLRSNGKFVLSGKAIRGALRHRALKILNTMNYNGEKELKEWMGWVDTGMNSKARKSRLRVEETYLENVEDMEQMRIRIDRFTGGVISGALFSSAPVWRQGDGNNVLITLTLNGYKHEDEKDKSRAALLLHVLKDLWMEDLAIGGEKNVGRGVLTGQIAKIDWYDSTDNREKSATIHRKEDNTPALGGEIEELKKEFNTALQPNNDKV